MVEVFSIVENRGIKSGINAGFSQWKMEINIIFLFQYVSMLLVNEERDQDGEDDCYGKNK